MANKCPQYFSYYSDMKVLDWMEAYFLTLPFHSCQKPIRPTPLLHMQCSLALYFVHKFLTTLVRDQESLKYLFTD